MPRPSPRLSGATTMLGGQEISVEAAGPLADITTRLAFANDPHELAEPDGLEAELRPYQRVAWPGWPT